MAVRSEINTQLALLKKLGENARKRCNEESTLRSEQVPWLVPTQCQCNDPIPKRWMRRHWLRLRDFGFRMQSLWIWGGWSCLARWQGDYFCFWSSGRRAPGSWSSLSSSSEGKDRARCLGPFHCQRTVHKGKRSHGETSLQNRNSHFTLLPHK